MRFFLNLLLFFSCLSAAGVPGPEVVDFFVDNAGKSYYLLADGNFVTDNPLGQNRFAYFDSSLGAPGGIDVTDPFALLLFYPEYGTVVVLDRTLSELSRTDLFALNEIRQPEVLARASDRGTWLFDSWDYRLKLLDPTGGLRLQSNDLRLTLKTPAVPTGVYVDRGSVLLHYADENKLAVFTNYGRFERWVSLPPAEHFSWRAPVLTGNSAAGTWTYRAGDQQARPRVQSGVGGKVFADRDAILYLGAEGRVVSKQIREEK